MSVALDRGSAKCRASTTAEVGNGTEISVRAVLFRRGASVMTDVLATAQPGLRWVDPATPMCRVVIIDPRSERLAITRLVIERCPELTVVGSAADLGEAQSQIRAERADVALVEINMPVDQGLVTIGALRSEFASLGIVVSSFHRDAATRDSALVQGADAYLAKPLEIHEFLNAIAGALIRGG